jgi:hypothetical protein
MITLRTSLWLWTGDSATWHFITVPKEVCGEIRAESFARRAGFRSVRVNATIGDVTWQTSVFPQKSGDYILPVKADVRRRADVAAGDEIELTLELI